jgi:hypothetical protein
MRDASSQTASRISGNSQGNKLAPARRQEFDGVEAAMACASSARGACQGGLVARHVRVGHDLAEGPVSGWESLSRSDSGSSGKTSSAKR